VQWCVDVGVGARVHHGRLNHSRERAHQLLRRLNKRVIDGGSIRVGFFADVVQGEFRIVLRGMQRLGLPRGSAVTLGGLPPRSSAAMTSRNVMTWR